jgi:hypothetical protein
MEQFLEPFDMSAGFKNPSDGDEAQIEVAARLLRFMSSLEYLRLHMYNTAFQNVIPSPVYQAFLDALAHYDFPRLQHLALCGLCASDVTLQTLVEKLLLLHILELRSVLLTRNSWEPVFAVLSQKKSLKRVALEGLLTPSRLLVNLEPLDRKLDAEDPKTFTQWIPHGPYMKLWHTREIEEEELRKGLAFRRIFSRISGSMADFQPHERFLNYLREYGPPPRGLWLG